jgi:two-component system, chemotaxis family, response regulator Rcp1
MRSTGPRPPVEILLVEDNLSDARLAAEALKESAHDSHLHWAADGIQAMEFLTRQGEHAGAPRPDIILLDLNLPRRDGRDILAEIKKDPALKGIPVIVLTCSDAQTDRTNAYELQASCFVTKPLEWDGFVRTIRAIVDFWLTQPALSAGAAEGILRRGN